MYSERILNVEKSTFTPLMFTTSGGMGPECQKLNKRLAKMIPEKKYEHYSQVMRLLRTRLRFALLKSTLVGLKGYIGKKNSGKETIEEDISCNIIPQEQCYESP